MTTGRSFLIKPSSILIAGTTVPPLLPQAVPQGARRAFTQDFNTAAALGSFDSTYGHSSAMQYKLGNYDGSKTTNDITLYSTAKCSYVTGGSYFCNMHAESTQTYTAAVLPLDASVTSPTSSSYLDFTYGQVGISVRLANYVTDSATGSTGYKIAFLLWPSSHNTSPYNGWVNEVDYPETDGSPYYDIQHSVYAVSMSDAQQAGGTGHFTGTYNAGVTLTDGAYHTFLLDWKKPINVVFNALNDTVSFDSSHNYSIGDTIQFEPDTAYGGNNPLTGGAPIVTNSTYYVKSLPSSSVLTLATTKGGTTLDITSDGTGQATAPMSAYLDGKLVYQWTSEVSIPRHPMHYVLQCEGWLKKDTSGNYIAPPTSTSALIEVPWVYVNTYI